MRYDPFLAIVISPQFGTRQKEESPIDIPFIALAFTIRFFQDWFEFSTLPMMIQIIQPSIGCAFVMCPINSPMLFTIKILSKVQQQIIRRHGTTGEEILTHPAIVKMITIVLVGKNVNKEFARWFQKAMNFVQEVLIILHVFKHFHRNDTIIVLDLVQSTLIIGHIALQKRKNKQATRKEQFDESYGIYYFKQQNTV